METLPVVAAPAVQPKIFIRLLALVKPVDETLVDLLHGGIDEAVKGYDITTDESIASYFAKHGVLLEGCMMTKVVRPDTNAATTSSAPVVQTAFEHAANQQPSRPVEGEPEAKRFCAPDGTTPIKKIPAIPRAPAAPKKTYGKQPKDRTQNASLQGKTPLGLTVSEVEDLLTVWESEFVATIRKCYEKGWEISEARQGIMNKIVDELVESKLLPYDGESIHNVLFIN
jgi:hypothetical protein